MHGAACMGGPPPTAVLMMLLTRAVLRVRSAPKGWRPACCVPPTAARWTTAAPRSMVISGVLLSTVTSAAAAAADKPEYRRVAVEMGTGTSLRREDHTAAAVRALHDALWRVSLTAYRALDKQPTEMKVEVLIGVPSPEQVDEAKVLAVVPYGECSIKVVRGGLAIQGGCGADAQGRIIMANAAVIVSLDVGDYLEFKRQKQAAQREEQAAADEADNEQLWTSPSGRTMSTAEAEAILAKHFK